MFTEDSDDLLPFEDVRVIRSTAPALFCRIGGKSVWLPRVHISGRLWCAGDRGRLYIRRWVARERRLLDIDLRVAPSLSAVRSSLDHHLHVVTKPAG